MKAAASPFPVLIEGESGAGKELVARAVHAASIRRGRRFCALNCAAIADDLVEAELFGHTRGAFTGAVAERAGLFEESQGGTLFLDEVAELSARVQAKLLRTLQEGEIRRLGESGTRKVDARIVAATNRPVGRGGQRRKIPERSALPPRRPADQHSAATRETRRPPAARAPHLVASRQEDRQPRGVVAISDVAAWFIRLAGQRPRVAERARVGDGRRSATRRHRAAGAAEPHHAVERGQQPRHARRCAPRIRGAIRARGIGPIGRPCHRGRSRARRLAAGFAKTDGAIGTREGRATH